MARPKNIERAARQRTPRPVIDPESIRADLIDGTDDEPLDVGPPSFRDFAKETAQGIRDLGETQTPKIGASWSEDDVDNLTFLATMLAMFAGTRLSYWAMKNPDLAPSDELAADFAQPLARIISRHVKIAKTVKGDMGDIFRLSGAMVGYAIHVFDIRDQRVANERRQVERMVDGPTADNVPLPKPSVTPTMRTVMEGLSMRSKTGVTWQGGDETNGR